MNDFDEFIRSLAHLNRSEMIDRLIAADASANSIARAASWSKRGTAAYHQAEDAKLQVERLGRIIYFLRFRNIVEGCSAEDLMLCNLLAERLKGKGQWRGRSS
jgi:hypothetical protein